MRDRILPIPQEVDKRGRSRFADTGDKPLASNRITAGKAAIVARHIAVLAALQIELEMFAEWEP